MLRHALDRIDRVHGDGALAAIELFQALREAAIWPTAGVPSRIRVNSVPSIGWRVMPFIADRHIFMKVTRPSAPFMISSGMTQPSISMPSRRASSRSGRRPYLLDGKDEVRSACTPSRWPAGHIVAVWPRKRTHRAYRGRRRRSESVNRGGRPQASPGENASVVLGPVTLEPFGLLEALTKGSLTVETWQRQCAELGIAGVDLGKVAAAKAETVLVSPTPPADDDSRYMPKG